jgi:hypothetical protein
MQFQFALETRREDEPKTVQAARRGEVGNTVSAQADADAIGVKRAAGTTKYRFQGGLE